MKLFAKDTELPERPESIKQALVLFIATLIILLLKGAFLFDNSLEVILSFTLSGVSSYALLGFLFYKIWYAENVARMALVFVMVARSLFSLQALLLESREWNFPVALVVLSIVIELLVAVVLYLPKSNQWFKEVKKIKDAQKRTKQK